MAKYSVFVPARKGSDMPDLTIRVEATNWLVALRTGLKQIGEQGDSLSNIMCETSADGSIRVADPGSRRVFVLKQIHGDEDDTLRLQTARKEEDARKVAEAAERERIEKANELRDAQRKAQELEAETVRRLAAEEDRRLQRLEAERRADAERQEADARARQIEAENRKIAEERARVEAENRRLAEERARLEEENRKLAELKARAEAEARKKKEAEEAARAQEAARQEAERAMSLRAQEDEARDRNRKELERLEAERRRLEAERQRLEEELKRATTTADSAAKMAADAALGGVGEVLVETSAKKKSKSVYDDLDDWYGDDEPMEDTTDKVIGDLFMETPNLYEMEPEKAAKVILDLVWQQIKCEAASVFFSDINSSLKDLVCVEARGPVAKSVMGARVPLGKGIVGFSVVNGVRLIVNNVHKNPNFYGQIDASTGFVTRSVLCVPIQADVRSFGAIELINKQGQQDWTTFDSNILEAVARILAKALETYMSTHNV